MNKPTVTHISRFDMKRMLKNSGVPDNTLIISINDTGDEESEILYLWNNLWIDFPPAHYGNNSNLVTYIFKDDEESLSELQANCIVEDVEFAKRHGKNIIVHCFAGVSRSAAVVKWANDYLKLNIEKYNNYTQHNKHVYDTLCRVSGVENINNYYRSLEEK